MNLQSVNYHNVIFVNLKDFLQLIISVVATTVVDVLLLFSQDIQKPFIQLEVCSYTIFSAVEQNKVNPYTFKYFISFSYLYNK